MQTEAIPPDIMEAASLAVHEMAAPDLPTIHEVGVVARFLLAERDRQKVASDALRERNAAHQRNLSKWAGQARSAERQVRDTARELENWKARALKAEAELKSRGTE